MYNRTAVQVNIKLR